MPRNCPRMSATGSSSSAASPTRSATITDGSTYSTAMRMKRYGVPQMTDSAMKRDRPRRDMARSRVADADQKVGIGDVNVPMMEPMSHSRASAMPM